MKSNSDDYQDILLLWESIWTCSQMREHLTKLREERKSREASRTPSPAVNQPPGSPEKASTPLPARPESGTSDQPDSAASKETKSSTNSSFNTSVFSLKELAAQEASRDRESRELSTALEASLKLEEQTDKKPPPPEEDGKEMVLNAGKLTNSGSSDTIASSSSSSSSEAGTSGTDGAAASKTSEDRSKKAIPLPYYPNNIYIPEVKRLSDTELYVLCICLCIIRRERDLIMANRYDATDILKHFNTLQLNSNLRDILIHASNIWSWLVYDEKEAQLYPGEPVSYASSSTSLHNNPGTSATSGSNPNQSNENNRNEADDFDLLPDARLSVNLSGEDYFLLNS